MEHGTVTTTNYEDGVVYCNVRAIRMDTQYRKVPLLKPHSGFIQVPKQGETVTMEQLADGTRFISNVISRESGTPDNLEEGELAIQLDKGSRVYFEEKQNGDYNLHLDASGDVLSGGDLIAGGFSGSHNDLDDVSSSDHHSRYTDSEALAAVNNDADHGSTASHDYFSGNHSDLIGVNSDDHHTRYSDSEAVSAVNNDTDHGSTAPHNYFSGSHTDLTNIASDDHHARYADSEAVSAVNAETSLSVDISGDADTVDGLNIHFQSAKPSNPQEGDIWIEDN